MQFRVKTFSGRTHRFFGFLFFKQVSLFTGISSTNINVLYICMNETKGACLYETD